MPTYEYLCESCRYRFEKFQNISDAPIKECPKCGKELKKLNQYRHSDNFQK
jgi:putative FmdB family regulatory protein